MIDLDVSFERPFGPSILVSKCPDHILKNLNDYIDDVEENENLKSVTSSEYGNIPNLLGRDVVNIYLTEQKCEETGLKQFVEFLGNYYLENNQAVNLQEIEALKLSIITNDEEFKYVQKYVYADCWINRYYKGDYTPIHNHGSDIAGVIFLKIPDDIKKMNNISDVPESNKLHGRLQFVYGHESPFCADVWTPPQEDGIIMIFPNWLKHLVYAQKTEQERRTLSFNLIDENEYYIRKEQIEGDHYGLS